MHNRTSSPNKESYFRKRLKRSWYPAVSRSRASCQWVDIGRRFSDNWSFGTWLRTCFEERTDEREKHRLIKKIIRLCGRIFTASLFCGQSPIYAECFFWNTAVSFFVLFVFVFHTHQNTQRKVSEDGDFWKQFQERSLKKIASIWKRLIPWVDTGKWRRGKGVPKVPALKELRAVRRSYRNDSI